MHSCIWMKYEHLNIDIEKVKRFDVDPFWQDNKDFIQVIADKVASETGQEIDQYMIRKAVWHFLDKLKVVYFGASWLKK